MAKSTYSGADSCVDVEIGDKAVTVAHDNEPEQGYLTFAHDEWRAFVLGVKAGEFDLPDGGAQDDVDVTAGVRQGMTDAGRR